ncbi:MAG: hypothetical protein ACPG6V_06045 [Flavobacteriales bacterium]
MYLQKNNIINNPKFLLLIFGIIILLGNLGVYLFFAPINVDEFWHINQINRYLNDDFSHEPMLTNIPGLHFIIFSISKLFNISTNAFFRLISGFVGTIGFISAIKLLQHFKVKNLGFQSLQLIFLPWLFSFIFLIYIEWFGVAFLVSGMYFTLKKKTWISCLFFLILLLGKQHFIPWVFMASIYFWINNVLGKSIKHYIKLLPYAILGGLFLVFIKWNGGISMEAKAMHSLSIEHENILTTLLLLGILYLPLLTLEKIKTIFNNKQKSWTFGILTILVTIGVIYFNPTHYFNTPKISCLHNSVINYMQLFLIFKAVCLLLMIVGIIHILTIPLREKSLYLLYPISILTLIPVVLVEFRYSIPFLILFNLFRVSENKSSERNLLIWFMFQALTIYILFALGYAP